MNFVKNGVLRLPPGFRFHPTDQELVVHYLTRKVLTCPLPASVIPDLDVCNSDPWDLPPGGQSEERYFFSAREAKYPNGKRSNRATLSGYWKATGKDKPILANANANSSVVVGMKKTLVFYRGKPRPPHGHASRTDWIMHEYRLLHPHSPTNNNYIHQKTGEAAGGWVLCRVFLKKRNNTNANANANAATKQELERERSEEEGPINNKTTQTQTQTQTSSPVFYDFMATEQNKTRELKQAVPPAIPCSSSSASSSALTHVHNHNQECDETSSSSCSNTFSPLPTKP